MSTLRQAAILKTMVDLIIDNGPGWILPSQDKLCDKLKVSRTSLREVMCVLEFANIVTLRPKVGSVVNPIKDWQAFSQSVATWKAQAGYKHGE